MSHSKETMHAFHSEGKFRRWHSIVDPWKPDLTLLQLFGSLPDINRQFSTPSRRLVRCRPQLNAFILGHTTYKHSFIGPDPEQALRALLRRCFLRDHLMFRDAHSPYQLLCSSHMILDMAFVRAVMTASSWLGPDAMPTGYIHNWPPPEGDAGL